MTSYIEKADTIVERNNFDINSISQDVSWVTKWTLEEVRYALRETVRDAVIDLIEEDYNERQH